MLKNLWASFMDGPKAAGCVVGGLTPSSHRHSPLHFFASACRPTPNINMFPPSPRSKWFSLFPKRGLSKDNFSSGVGV